MAKIPSKIPITPHQIQGIRTAMLGLAGVCVVCVTQMLTMPALDRVLVLALGGFAIAIPTLVAAGMVFEEFVDESFLDCDENWNLVVVFMVGSVCGILGLTFLFWHFHWVFGILFLSTSVRCIAWFTIWPIDKS